MEGVLQLEGHGAEPGSSQPMKKAARAKKKAIRN